MSITYRTDTDSATLAAAHRLYHTACTAPDGIAPAISRGYAQASLCLEPVSREVSDGWFAGAERHTVTTAARLWTKRRRSFAQWKRLTNRLFVF